MTCVFCKIASGEIPTNFVYEDELVVAFRDIRPLTQSHVLVVPKAHVVSMWELDDPALAGALLDNGVNPDLTNTEGRKAMDFATAAGQVDMQELLVQHRTRFDYGKLMFGLTWRSRLEDARDIADVCRDLPTGYTACRLKVAPWLDDVAAVIGQFDRQSGGRLVALQIDSKLLNDPAHARQRFEAAIREVEKRLPRDHSGFATRQEPPQGPFFEGLRPGVGKGNYSSYWSDENRTRPVFVHLKLSGFRADSGYYRILIGNPFRAG